MDAYLSRLSRIPRLDATEEHDLAVRVRGGDVAAREQLITASLPLVLMRGRRLGLHGQRLLDAIQAGSIGLIEAIDRFDPARGCRLSTYAWWWIGRAMAGTFPEPTQAIETDLPAPVITDSDLRDFQLDGLDPDLAAVLVARFGKASAPGAATPRSEVARSLGLSVSQVRTKEAKALSHLRQGLAKVGHRAPFEHHGADPL